MESKKKLSLEESSIDELLDAADGIIQDQKNCHDMMCSKCRCNNDNFKGTLKNIFCVTKREFFTVLKMAQEKLQKNSSQVGKCSECKFLDKSYLSCSGFHFCMHWHNFTTENGFCHEFESKEISSESVDNWHKESGV